jgi:ABC-type multidrug transport system fused ATPase/permease subunit
MHPWFIRILLRSACRRGRCRPPGQRSWPASWPAAKSCWPGWRSISTPSAFRPRDPGGDQRSPAGEVGRRAASGRAGATGRGCSLSRRDHSGVGTIELCDADSLLALWRYTLGSRYRGRTTGRPLHPPAPPSSHRRSATAGRAGPLPEVRNAAAGRAGGVPGVQQGNSRAAFDLDPAPPGRFARPYKLATAGRLRAVAVDHRRHAGSAVPDHADDGQGADPLPERSADRPRLVVLYLSGLLGASLLAWVLGWGRTYILALVSERIGADLRTATYEHLLKLSQEYFGGKRTGDLMARIGSETDRINIFISLHLLDFATDVLMIVMTTAILVSIDPWLAAVTLLPLPIIAWLIHVVRERLRTGFERVDRVWAEVTNVLADTIPGIRVVKAFAQEAREAARFRAANVHNLEVNDRVNKRLVAVLADRHPAHRNRPADRLGLRHLADRQGPDHGRRAHRLPRLHQPFLPAPRLDEPHRFGDAEGSRRRQAHFRHSRPRLERSRADPSGAPAAASPGASSCAASASATARAASPATSTSSSSPARWSAWSATAAPARARWST